MWIQRTIRQNGGRGRGPSGSVPTPQQPLSGTGRGIHCLGTQEGCRRSEQPGDGQLQGVAASSPTTGDGTQTSVAMRDEVHTLLKLVWESHKGWLQSSTSRNQESLWSENHYYNVEILRKFSFQQENYEAIGEFAHFARKKEFDSNHHWGSPQQLTQNAGRSYTSELKLWDRNTGVIFLTLALGVAS